MRILQLSHYAGAPDLGMMIRPYLLGVEWRAQGHAVRTLAAAFAHTRYRQPPEVAPPWRIDETPAGGMQFLPTPPYGANGLARARNMLAFCLRAYRAAPAIARDFKPEVVMAASTYPMDIYPAARIARRAGAALVFELHDIWPLTPMQLGGMPWWHPFILVTARAMRRVCRSVDLVVSLLPGAEPYLASQGLPPGRFVYVPNGVQPEAWDQRAADPAGALPAEHAARLEALREAGAFVVGYAGGHGATYALDALLTAGARLRDERVHVVLVGKGDGKAALAARVAQEGIDNVHLLDPIFAPQVPAMLARFDAAYLGLARKPLFRYGVSPNKLFEYMMARRPVIQAIDTDHDLVRAAGCGESVPAEDPEALAAAIRRMRARTPAERAALGEAGRAYVLAGHQYPTLARRCVEAFAALGPSTPPADA